MLNYCQEQKLLIKREEFYYVLILKTILYVFFSGHKMLFLFFDFECFGIYAKIDLFFSLSTMFEKVNNCPFKAFPILFSAYAVVVF